MRGKRKKCDCCYYFLLLPVVVGDGVVAWFLLEEEVLNVFKKENGTQLKFKCCWHENKWPQKLETFRFPILDYGAIFQKLQKN